MENILKLILPFYFVGLAACGGEGDVYINEMPATSDSSASAEPIEIIVLGSDDLADYPLSNLIDNNEFTFWHSENLELGDVKSLLFGFSKPLDIGTIRLVDKYTGDYSLGDLSISISFDSTNGLNGTWRDVAFMNAEFNSSDILINADAIKWLRFDMKYSGTGGHGGSPAFYLSEVYFD